MRSDAFILVECDECHDCIEVPLTRTEHKSVWTGYGVGGYLTGHGWIYDPAEQKDYCCEQCYKAGTKGRRHVGIEV